MPRRIDAQQLADRVRSRHELALIDVRERGRFNSEHLFHAVSIPLSRLELRLADLVPARSTPVVLCDDDEQLSERAAQRMNDLGFTDVSVLEGGLAAWRAAGYPLYQGVNVPSKAFGEHVLEAYHTPRIPPAELKQMLDRGGEVLVLDSRPDDEYRQMNIPGSIDVPGCELPYRIFDLLPSPTATVIVNCAGRTRSIIGAQSLINAGVSNPVFALENGTMGWELEGFTLEHGQARHAPPVSPDGLARARAAAAQVAQRFGVSYIDAATLHEWQQERDRRSLFLLDVRSPEEYEAGHLPGSKPAPGGQLVQETDRYVGVLRGRVVLLDDTGVRAVMTASWLIQMGWETVYVLAEGLGGFPLQPGSYAPEVLGLAGLEVPEIEPSTLAPLLEQEAAALIDLETSRTYRRGHIPGAQFAIRSRLKAALSNLPEVPLVVITSRDGVLARLAAPEVQALTNAPVKVLTGGTSAWRAAGLPMETGATRMLSTTDDVAPIPHETGTDRRLAMQGYLDWEVELSERIAHDESVRFSPVPPDP